MRILLINDYYQGGGAEGVFRSTLELLNIDNSFEVEYFVGSLKNDFHPSGPFAYVYNKEIEKKMSTKLEQFLPDVIHIHNFYHVLTSSIFGAIKKFKKTHAVKVIMTAHDYYLISPSVGLTYFKDKTLRNKKGSSEFFGGMLFKRIDHRGWKFSIIKKTQWLISKYFVKFDKCIDEIIAPSNFMIEMLMNAKLKNKLTLIRNPLSDTPSEHIQKKSTKEIISIVFAGRLSQEKGVKEFLNAYSKICINSKENIEINIFGDGDELPNLNQIINTNNLKNVFLRGFKTQETLKTFMLDANVLILPSLWFENAPLSIIEGAIYGNIILTMDRGGMAEMAKMTNEYVLVKNWENELTESLDQIKTKSQNSLKKENLEQFLESTYISNLKNVYSKY